MTGDEIRDRIFPLRIRGYDPAQVDAWLAYLADVLEAGPSALVAGTPALPLLPQRTFSVVVRGYHPDEVDKFVAGLAGAAVAAGVAVLPALPDGQQRRFGTGWRRYAAECSAEWQRVSDLPGVRLRRAGRKIIGSHDEVLLTRRDHELNVSTGQVLRAGPGGAVFDVTSGIGEPILWMHGRHTYRDAAGIMLLPRQRYLTFPVTGTRPGNAVMTAVNESGATELWFRKIGLLESEAVASPGVDLTTEVLCIIELTAPWLWSYFKPELGEGGG